MNILCQTCHSRVPEPAGTGVSNAYGPDWHWAEDGTPRNLLYLISKVSHYSDVIMGAIASKITSLTVVYSTVYSDADQRKHQSSASLAFVRGIHRGPVTQKMFPFDDVIMNIGFIMVRELNKGPIAYCICLVGLSLKALTQSLLKANHSLERRLWNMAV